MDKKTMLQVLLPAGAAAAVVLLVGALIALGTGESPPAGKVAAPGESAAPAGGDTAGTTLTLPAADAPEWQPAAGGMKTWDAVEGTGSPCPPAATVTIHYTGWTLDGQIFDSSVQRGSPATFPLGNLIKGWQEGIPGMKPGGVRRLFIPSAWAYGAAGSGKNIPPNADLVFEVKLIAVK